MTRVTRPQGRARRGPQATPRNNARGVLRALLATVGIGIVFVALAFRAFSGASTSGPEDLTPPPDAPTSTPGPTPTPVPRAAQDDLGPPLIALQAGHTGINPTSGLPDPGTVCPDGLSEVQITQSVTERVAQNLRERGFPVVVLEQYDPRLDGLRATLFVAIHVDSCEYINDEATGYKVSGPETPRDPATPHQALVDCLTSAYAAATGLHFHAQSITHDMTDYEAFRLMDPRTPAAVIELGFLNLDRALLTEGQAKVSQGVTDGLACFLQQRR